MDKGIHKSDNKFPVSPSSTEDVIINQFNTQEILQNQHEVSNRESLFTQHDSSFA